MTDQSDDIAALSPTPTINLAAGLVALVGFLLVLSGFQLWISVRFYVRWVEILPWSMMVLGLASMYVGPQMYRMRGWAALASICLMSLAVLGMGGFTIFAFRNGLLSCVMIFAPLLGIAGLTLSIAARPKCQRADCVRERMRDAGMDLGI